MKPEEKGDLSITQPQTYNRDLVLCMGVPNHFLIVLKANCWDGTHADIAKVLQDLRLDRSRAKGKTYYYYSVKRR